MRLEFWHKPPPHNRRLELTRRRHAPPHIGPRMRLLQAKDVPEGVILGMLRAKPGVWWTHWRVDGMPSLPAASPELAAFPAKVLHAKLVSMRRRGLVNGGGGVRSRGDWHVW